MSLRADRERHAYIHRITELVVSAATDSVIHLPDQATLEALIEAWTDAEHQVVQDRRIRIMLGGLPVDLNQAKAVRLARLFVEEEEREQPSAAVEHDEAYDPGQQQRAAIERIRQAGLIQDPAPKPPLLCPWCHTVTHTATCLARQRAQAADQAGRPITPHSEREVRGLPPDGARPSGLLARLWSNLVGVSRSDPRGRRDG